MCEQSLVFGRFNVILVILLLAFPSRESFAFGFTSPTQSRLCANTQFFSYKSTSTLSGNSSNRSNGNRVLYSNVDFNEGGKSEVNQTTASKVYSSALESNILKRDDAENSSQALERIVTELTQAAECLSTLFKYSSMNPSTSSVSAEEIVQLCDSIDEEKERLVQTKTKDNDQLFVDKLELRKRSLEISRYRLLANLMKKDYSAYVATASFLSPSRINRLDLPNVQDIPYNGIMPSTAKSNDSDDNLVDDCTLDNKTFNDSLLDKTLMKIFRNLVEKNTNGVTSSKEGIDGLLEQGRTFMLQPDQTAEAQHKMVRDTLGGLMTPVLPPFYRIFMSGIIPDIGIKSLDGKQFGPWFYAPWLTSIVTPTFFGFLVGPSRPNRRKDGERGGLVVEKCKFLQESNCKGLCLHQCKLPAQQFFKDELGLDLTVSPNFATQECQWSFGEAPLSPDQDPSFPKGCIKSCGSRLEVAKRNEDSIVPVCS